MQRSKEIKDWGVASGCFPYFKNYFSLLTFCKLHNRGALQLSSLAAPEPGISEADDSILQEPISMAVTQADTASVKWLINAGPSFWHGHPGLCWGLVKRNRYFSLFYHGVLRTWGIYPGLWGQHGLLAQMGGLLLAVLAKAQEES